MPTGILYKQPLTRQHKLALNDQFLDGLELLTKARWEQSKESGDAADWLNVTIGVISRNRLRLLALEAKKDGVHGLIAGGTGSGKSELLTTLVVGLALNYDPSILNFVLVDYKGGDAFSPFENLPHCVDIITNLNKGDVWRIFTFTAINAEMLRRRS